MSAFGRRKACVLSERSVSSAKPLQTRIRTRPLNSQPYRSILRHSLFTSTTLVALTVSNRHRLYRRALIRVPLLPLRQLAHIEHFPSVPRRSTASAGAICRCHQPHPHLRKHSRASLGFLFLHRRSETRSESSMKKLRALAQARQQARSAFNAAAGASPTRPTSASPSTAAAAVASPPHTHQDLETELGDDPSPNMEDAKRIADEAMARHSQFLEEIIHESSLADIHIVSPAQPSVPSLAVQETSPIHAPQDLEQQQPPPTPLQQEQQELQTAEYQNATGPAFAAAPVSKAAGKRVSGGKEEATPTIPAPDQAADMSSVAEVSVDGPAPPTLGAPSDAREGLVPAKRTRAAKRNRTKNPARKDSGNSEGGMETQESTLNADGKPILQIPKSNAQRPYMYFTGGNRPAGRLRWSEEETKALMESLDLICALKEEQQVIQPYSIVLRMHGPRGSVSTVLANRNNVQLKDKSRNECLRLKRSGEPVPFWRTTLHTSLWVRSDRCS